MKATEANLLHFLKKSPQFVVPIYQRTYSWTEQECIQMWKDILRTGGDDNIHSHFVGSIVYINEAPFAVIEQPPILVIDGQQRLATISLIIEALARELGETEPIDGFSATKLRNYYLLNSLEYEMRRYKLLLTQTDKETLLRIIDQKPLPDKHSLRIKENFKFFEKKIKAMESNLGSLCNGLAKLMIVDISLERGVDDPQLIFESMNSIGRELSQADLIRNFILMGLELKHQNCLYNDHWRPIEIAFGQEAYGEHFDGFMRHYLTVKTEEIPKIREVYEAFKTYASSHGGETVDVNVLVADIKIFAGYYCAMALGGESDTSLAAVFADLRNLKVDVAYPLLLRLYHDYAEKRLSVHELEQAVRLIESYVFRRAVCAIPTNSLNKTFATFSKKLNQCHYLESMQAHFLLLPSYRRFPDDEEFRRELKVRDLYNFRNRSYWLRKLEHHQCKEQPSRDAYTIEHIMPQNENISEEWQMALGDDWRTVQKKWLHTLGNLTLTGYNSEYSDRSFAEKRDMEHGFRDSPLQLNKGLKNVETWNEKAIQDRAECLAQKASDVWAAPNLPTDVLDRYRPKAAKPDAYTINDHKYLVDSRTTRALYEALRAKILELDPCVTEEFRKHYIAYKAETNFVDVVPQVQSLKLSLNIPFHELHDPYNLARDVTNIGSLGNGDVDVNLRTQDEFPYVMGLVRQSFERQMGDEV
ncbi:GmrSD restriction endonuclease domain-containing protein [Candidatus Spongiihabitans sp.]|uniref:GmrSD restriction endonuclease domain-containing protein n=1 Tax=Candidatus Spongiihabitans sp. TaxID=3101308 RepID=UPI003C7C28CB